MSRIHCHSAFKHYEMFHGNRACCGGNSYGSVFNTTYNINCGGHRGGFWNGFGMGLGAMVGNWFGGIMGNMGFGGFGGGMGFGFPSFGGFGGGMGFGFPMLTNWFGGITGNNGNNGTNGTNGKDGVNDADNILIENFKKEIEKLSSDASEELQKNLYNRIKAKLDKPEDSVYEKQNKLAYKELLDMLEDKFGDTDFGSGSKKAEKKSTPVETTDTSTKIPVEQSEKAASAPKEEPVIVEDTGTITVGGKPVKIADLASIDGLKGMTDAELAAVTKPQAEAALEKLGYITTDANGNKVGHLSNVYAVLKLLEKSGVTVEVETRTASSDQWVKGPISNVEKDSEGKLSYNVNCSGVAGATLEGNYKFTAQDKENKTYKCSTQTSGIKVADIEVNYQGEKQPLINRTAQALATEA